MPYVCRDPKDFSQVHCIFRGLQLVDSSDILRVRIDSLTAELLGQRSASSASLDVALVRVED